VTLVGGCSSTEQPCEHIEKLTRVPHMQKVDSQTKSQLSSFNTEGEGYTLIVPKNEFNDTSTGGARKTLFLQFGVNASALSPENATKVWVPILKIVRIFLPRLGQFVGLTLDLMTSTPTHSIRHQFIMQQGYCHEHPRPAAVP
jgi:hypothetical protein